MSQMIILGKEIIRICPTNACKIEYSTNNGLTWYMRNFDPNHGEFRDLVLNGSEIIALTSKGTYFSKNKGLTWLRRC